MEASPRAPARPAGWAEASQGALEAQALDLGPRGSACISRVSVCAAGGGLFLSRAGMGFGEEAASGEDGGQAWSPCPARSLALGDQLPGRSSCHCSPMKEQGSGYLFHFGSIPVFTSPGWGGGGSRSGGGSAVGGGRARTWVTQGGARVEDPAGRAGRAQGSALTPPGHRGATTTRGPHFPPLPGCWQPCPHGGRCDCREGSRKSLGDSRHLFPIVPGVPITCRTLSRLRKD